MIPYRLQYDSEIVVGLVGAVGIDHEKITNIISERLTKHNYNSTSIRVSRTVIPKLSDRERLPEDKYERAVLLMDLGNELRQRFDDDGIIALAAVADINKSRHVDEDGGYEIGRHAYIISSFKRPEEVTQLRYIYSRAFYLIGVYSSPERRKALLINQGVGMTEEHANDLIRRDESEELPHGQKTRDTFQLADFFVEDDGNEDNLRNSIYRIIDLVFGHPYITPTFDEYAMFLAFAASLRSADLSRQVGAIIAKDQEILSSGANDCPKAHGGLYWPEYSDVEKKVCDSERGRDYKRGHDTNVVTRNSIIEKILASVNQLDRPKVAKAITESDIGNVTEFGRMVHAEMEALLNCARNTIACRGGTLYATTFPCHNCAKHIIAAGIKKVIYVQPYPKSKAFEFYDDSITVSSGENEKVMFRPFIGVGPRQFFNLFSMNLSSGRPLRRENDDGKVFDFDYQSSEPRVLMSPFSYLEEEQSIVQTLDELTQHNEENNKSSAD